MYAVNNTSPNVGMGSYELKTSDSITLYGIWGGGDRPNNVETNYTYFDKNEYTVKKNTALSLDLKGLGYDADYNSIVKEMKDASVIAASYTDETSTATEKNATVSAKTDDTGTASLTFQTAGKYVLSAYRKAADGIHYDISRPYAIVTVTDDTPTATPTSTPTSVPTATPASTQSPAPSAPPSEAVAPPVSVKVPTKPTSVKAVVKKSTKKKKAVTLTWKKVKSASGYCVSISTKKNKGFKKLADVKKTKLTFKKKKGTYYVNVKAYIKSGSKRIYSKASKTLKIKVK